METHNDKPTPQLQPIRCNICQKSFVYKKCLEKHILNKHVNDKEKDYKCTQCFKSKQLVKSFSTKNILNNHIQVVHGPPRFKCQVCFKTFKKSSNFTAHKRTHSQIGQILIQKCGICSKPFSSNQMLQRHLFYVHNHRSEDKAYFKCEICFSEFLERSALELHVIRQHVVDKAFECPVCSKTFIDQQTIDRHMKCHDKQLTFFCDVCLKGFKLKISLIQHLGVKHEKFFYCDRKCLKSFKNKPDFDQHISDSKQELKCYICQEIIKSECSFNVHLNSHVKEIKPEKIVVKIEKNIHNIEETNELSQETESTKTFKTEKFECEHCSKTFDLEAYFTAHRNQMHPNAKWKCNFEQCTKSFRFYNELKNHKITHTETKQFVCNICLKSFHLSKHLKKHEQVHVEEKKFQCKICPKSFLTSFQLRVHIANNHGGLKPFKCPVFECETSWASKYELKYHLVSHQTEKSFQCEMCTPFKAYKSLQYLKIHQTNCHLESMKTTTQRLLQNVKTKKNRETLG